MIGRPLLAKRAPIGRRAWIGALILLLWAGLAALAFQAVRIEPNRIVVEDVHIPVAGLPPELDGLRMVQLTDMHMAGIGRREADVAARVRDLEPDLILITGDFIQHTVLLDVQERWMEAVAEWLRTLGTPTYGIWASRGNADISRYGDFNNVFADGLRAGGAHLLVNSAEAVEIDAARLWIAGADFNDFQGRFLSDFAVREEDGNRWVEAGPSEGNSTLNYWGADALNWRDYEFSGRLRREDARGGVGVIFYSRFPEGYDRYYRLRSYEKAPTLQITAHGTHITAGEVDTGVEPAPGVWYRFRIWVESGPAATRIRARVWAEDEPEPQTWQADCTDASDTRLTAGTVGMWGLDDGTKAVDALRVHTLAGGQPLLEEDFEGTPPGARPVGWLAYGMNAGNVTAAMRDVPAEEISILLAHSPDQVREAEGTGVDLMLAGHTHGGQVRLPLIGAVVTGTRLGPQYASGLFRWDDFWLYISRGIGMRGLPIRFLCPPEITLITLERVP